MLNEPVTEQEFWSILAAMPEPQPVFFRLYYDNRGHPLFYSMEDLPGNYIEIDVETFRSNDVNVKVRNGKIVKINPRHSSKLVPSESGTACHANDVAVVVTTKENCKWNLKNYESDD